MYCIFVYNCILLVWHVYISSVILITVVYLTVFMYTEISLWVFDRNAINAFIYVYGICEIVIDYRLLEIIAVTLPKVYRLELASEIGLRI